MDYKKGGNLKRMIVIHHTGSVTTLERMLSYFKKDDQKSIHYIVDTDGRVAQQIDEDDIAFHAGVSAWGEWRDINPVSIGIEVISDGLKFTSAQRDAVVDLCLEIMTRNHIDPSFVVRHADVALPKGRKWDIGENFYIPFYGSWLGFQKTLEVRLNPDPETEIKEAKEWAIKHNIWHENDLVRLHRASKKIIEWTKSSQ